MLMNITKQLSFAFFLAALSGCASMENLDFSRMFQSLTKNSKTHQSNLLKQEAEELLLAGKADETLVLLQDEIKKPATHPALSNQYITALNMVIAQADQKTLNRNFLEAGNRYHTIASFYPEDSSLHQKIALDKDEISLKMNFCADKLLQDGLQFYRSGQLEKAINVWTQIMEFHPSYKASSHAIQTTKTQLEKLELLNQNSSPDGT